MSVLELEIRFLDDRYHGSGDWPPDPARLFQGLVCGGQTGVAACSWSSAHDEALEWLSSLPPPAIDCLEAQRGRRYSIFVPNNSLDRNKTNTKTTKRVAPQLLPARGAEAPDVVYRWRPSDLDQARGYLPILDDLAARLPALGWGVDVAAASAVLRPEINRPTYLKYEPAPNGPRSLRTLEPGLLQHLRDSYQASVNRITKQGVNPFTRPADFPMTRYANVGTAALPRTTHAYTLQRLDEEPFSHPWRQTAAVAAWMRHMAGEAMQEEYPKPVDKEWIDSFVMGHTDEHEIGRRISYVPLPSVGHTHSDGAIRRALLIEPPGADSHQADVFRLLARKALNRPLTRAGDRQPQAVLTPRPARDSVFDRYLTTARTWRSVTPVVLHGHNARGKSISVSKTEKLLMQALEAAGYPTGAVERIYFQAAPYWAGCESAAAIRAPAHLDKWPRLHVAVDFNTKIQGPVAIGLGRHCGIGVFAAHWGKRNA